MAGEESDEGSEAAREPLLAPATKSSLLWGIVGGLSFLVLVQGYELVGNPRIGIAVKALVALVVAVGATGLTYATRDKLPEPDTE